MALNQEQLKAKNHDLGNILVSASAGSGKTHTMIERVKRLVIEKGVSINEILAVTFTESAASDMKQKLKKALSEVVCSENSQISNEQVKWCELQLDEVDTADISTMHSFCARLIRSYFFVCSLSPDFKILDESDAGVIKNTAIEKTFKDFYDQGEEWFLTLIDRHAQGRQDANLKQLVLKSYEFCDSEANPMALAERYRDIYTEEGFNKLLDEYKAKIDKTLRAYLDEVNFAHQAFLTAEKEKAAEFAKNLSNYIAFVLNASDIYAFNKLKNFKLDLRVERNLTETLKEQKDKLASIRDEFKKIVEKVLAVISDDKGKDLTNFIACGKHTENFVKVLSRYAQVYSQIKREENALDFNDLEHYALEILSNDEINEEISGKYKYLFIDEYQDTNGVQEEILTRLSRDDLFMVGDAKQSIYGFRGCRSKFFSEKFKKMSDDGKALVRLNENYRSADNVIKFINAVFNFCMTDAVYGEEYKTNSQLVGGGIYPENFVGRAQLHLLVKESSGDKKVEEPRIYDLLNHEIQSAKSEGMRASSLVAKLIFDERKKTIYDVKEKVERFTEYKDIAVLTRNKNGQYVTDLVKGLRMRGIPVTADVSENVCDYPEIQVMINALKLVDCFMQDLPLASTLKSPLGGFTDEDLFEIARYFKDNSGKHGGFYDAYSFYLSKGDSALCERLKEFNDYFTKIRLVSDFIGAHGVINKLVADKNYTAFLYAEKDGVDKVDRLNRFVQASIANGKTLTVKEFLARVNNCPEAFDISPFASENNVKVMTIHSSKGLEFPVVITCGLERDFNDEDDYAEVIKDRDYGFAFKYYDDKERTKKETILRNTIRENLNVQRIQEEMRLFYVALTRATYSLHLIFSAKEDKREQVFKKANRFVDFIPSFIPLTEHTYQEIDEQVREINPRKVIIGKPDEQMVNEIKAKIEYVYPFSEDVNLPLKSSVTELATLDDTAVYTHVLFDEQSPDKEKGTIAHKLLEHFDFDANLSVYEQADLLVERGVLKREELLGLNLDRINVALISGAFDEIKGKKLYREQPFLFSVSANKVFKVESQTPVVVQGVIDLLVVGETSAKIIDYKYSSLDAKSLKEKYSKQLNLYAQAVEGVLNKRVDGKVLVNIFTGETVIVD